MGAELPAELAPLAGALGVEWPRADEDELYGTALRWQALAGELRDHGAALADRAASLDLPVPVGRFEAAALAADVLAGCLLTLATVTAELKRYAVHRLGELAALLATGTGAYADLVAVALTGAAVRRATHTAGTLVDGRLVPLLRSAAAVT
jgi:hypothetical protein